LRRDQGKITAGELHIETIVIRNNRLAVLLQRVARRHDRVDKFVPLGKINPKSAAQAEYEFLEYTGHDDLLNELITDSTCYAIEI
jgi:hypothetical protein